MKITRIEIRESRLPKIDKEWRFALAAMPVQEGWVVVIHAEDGALGYGYASSMPHVGSPHAMVKADLERLTPSLVGKDSRLINVLLDEVDQLVPQTTQAKAGIDCALHDLLARRLNVPIAQLFGGAAVKEFRCLRILPIKSPAEMARNARELADKGFRHFKIKIHGNIEEDVACVAAVRKEVGPDLFLTVDANQSYEADDAIKALNLMAPYRIDLAEQPVNVDDFAGLKKVKDAVEIPIEADESAESLDNIIHLVRERAVDAVSLKISKLGGLRGVHAAAQICAAGGIKYRLGAHSGPRILSAHGAQIASALPGIWYACELTEFDGLEKDPWNGLELKDGVLRLSEAPGCGVTPV
jgi:L-alanine-DL-glutamate epimerase-like enolase superfamily enzyme